jgi:hypothetical protein
MVKRTSAFVFCVAALGSPAALGQPDERQHAAENRSEHGADSRASEPGTEARRSFEQGLELLRGERWLDAEQAFRRSLAIVPRDSTRYDLAFVLYKQGRIRESLAILEALLGAGDMPTDARYREYAEALKPHVVAQLARLHLRVAPANARLFVDGRDVSQSGPDRELSLDPGQHTAEISAPGLLSERFSFSAFAGAHVERSVVLVPVQNSERPRIDARPANEPAAPAAIHTYGPWIAIGLGGALLVGGVVTGVLASNADNQFVEQCPTFPNCGSDSKDAHDRALAFGHAADILFVSGGVITAGGIGWKLLAPTAGSSPRTGRTVGVVFSGVY